MIATLIVELLANDEALAGEDVVVGRGPSEVERCPVSTSAQVQAWTGVVNRKGPPGISARDTFAMTTCCVAGA